MDDVADNNIQIIDKLSIEYYTNEQVAFAVGRKPEYWRRIRSKYIVKYNLHVIKVGRRLFYLKTSVDAMIRDMLENGDHKTETKENLHG